MKPPGSLDVSSAVKRLREEESTPSRKKRVSFGPYVSPEYFDKALPPSTPVRKVYTLYYSGMPLYLKNEDEFRF